MNKNENNINLPMGKCGYIKFCSNVQCLFIYHLSNNIQMRFIANFRKKTISFILCKWGSYYSFPMDDSFDESVTISNDCVICNKHIADYSYQNRIKKFDFDYIKNKIENGFDLFSDFDRIWHPNDATAHLNRVFSNYIERWFQLDCPNYLKTMIYTTDYCCFSKDFLKEKARKVLKPRLKF